LVAGLGWLGAGLTGCVSNPSAQGSATAQQVAPKDQLQFTDLQGFDRDLSGSLSAPLPQVDVAFFDRITPSALPDRLQKWMAAVESGGGKVAVVPPKSSVTAKSPLMLVSAVSTLWSANKMIKEAAVAAQYRAAAQYDAEIQLKVDDKGDTVVDKVVFKKRG
jgi:hypothetical protein